MIKSIKLLSIGFLGALAMSSCSKEDPTPEPKQKFTFEFSAGENGTVNPSGPQTGEEGTQITSIANPEETYLFAGWFKEDEPDTPIGTSDDWTVKDSILTVKFTSKTSGKKFMAKFAKTVYNVKFEAEEGGTVTNAGGPVAENDSIKSTAQPSTNYGVDGWYDGETKITTTETSEDVYVSNEGKTLHVKSTIAVKDKIYKAKFSPYYSVTFSTQGGGDVSSFYERGLDGSYVTSSTVEKYYETDGWYDGETKITATETTENVYVSDNGKTLHVKLSSDTNDKNYKAQFKIGGSRIDIVGSGDSARLLLTKDPKNGGAYLQFGSIIARTGNQKVAAFNPSKAPNEWIAEWKVGDKFPEHTVANLVMGKGDPCKLLGFTQKEIKDSLAANIAPDNKEWRLPTKEENRSFAGESSAWETIDGINGRYIGPGSLTGKAEFFPAAGLLNYQCELKEEGFSCSFWSSIADASDRAYYMRSDELQIDKDITIDQVAGISVRCVRQQ
ncbi:MAG: InlB B-repeat-containing protein [Phocaeicola sp.]